jgi:hypothetical protein
MNVNKASTKGYENKRLHRREENKPNQTQLFKSFLPKGRSLPPKGRIVSPLRVSVPDGKSFVPKGTENAAEKGLTTPASGDSLKIKRWADKAVCLC